eukprot:TRINITY_DN10194_c0_g1_i1.p1 TRINITY_DN10194_c0_g1~~TRINITY_DN10194_c0_g1_i1.p1  ORF type:complete len:150 (-),score=8.17 TRINITY_DN10194_c0_g1_i1:53-502(-)
MATEYKIAVVGAGGVGKSSLVVRFIQGSFIQKYEPTVEDSYRKMVEVDKKPYILNLYDTAGQESYSALREQYIKIAHGFILVFSLASQPSFHYATRTYDNIRTLSKETTDIPILFVENKVDLESERLVLESYAQEFARSKNIPYILFFY